MAERLPRDLHPGAWWIWALGLAAAASRTTSPWLLLVLVLCAGLVVAARRGEAPWALGFKYYVYLALLVVALRVFFRVVLGGDLGEPYLFTLPEVPLPDWAAGVSLLGPVSTSSVLAGLYDGLRLAAILLCVGAANTLANPRRLLASLPPALYEVGTALVVAVTVFPQLADSVQRVRTARRLRGDPGKGVGALRRLVVPVLEDALERSMTLAAGMDTRGYGRAGDLSRRQRAVTGLLLVGGLVGIGVGAYAVLDPTAPAFLSTWMLALGALLAVGGLVTAGRRVRRTRYRPTPWGPAEVVVAASGVAVAVLVHVVASVAPRVVDPGLTAWPPLSVLAVAAMMVALVPAVAAPPPRTDDRPAPPRPRRQEVAS
jgi:energy-coupling factor transport system permease protein